jgi:hypothetical protein
MWSMDKVITGCSDSSSLTFPELVIYPPLNYKAVNDWASS